MYIQQRDDWKRNGTKEDTISIKRSTSIIVRSQLKWNRCVEYLNDKANPNAAHNGQGSGDRKAYLTTEPTPSTTLECHAIHTVLATPKPTFARATLPLLPAGTHQVLQCPQPKDCRVGDGPEAIAKHRRWRAGAERGRNNDGIGSQKPILRQATKARRSWCEIDKGNKEDGFDKCCCSCRIRGREFLHVPGTRPVTLGMGRPSPLVWRMLYYRNVVS